MKEIKKIAKKINIKESDLEFYGKYKAKLPLSLIDKKKIKKNNLILVTSINPTPSGEGKTTVSIGLTDGLNKIGKKTIAVLREPSLGPVFGLKGTATGGGCSQIIPNDDINLHFTGDFNAVEKANNLLSSIIDNHLKFNNDLKIDSNNILWKRAIDLNDRSLREIITSVRGKYDGVIRKDSFLITPASEIMAILCMSTSFSDLKKRLGDILVAFSTDEKPIFAKDLKAVDAMAILLKDAIKPNLVQTLEGNPAIVHGGPFANIAQGTNTILATQTGMSLSEYTVTEAGFGADLGAEKFLNIKSQSFNLKPKIVVIVATIKALKFHGGTLKNNLEKPNLKNVMKGFVNLQKHIKNIKKFNLTPVIALNIFPTDTKEEIDWLLEKCADLNIKIAKSNTWKKGSGGSIELSKMVVEEIQKTKSNFKPIYEFNLPVKEKIKIISEKIYGATDVVYEKKAISDLEKIMKLGFDNFAICMAKTEKSFSGDESLKGCPTNFDIKIREIKISAGAKFLIPIVGNIIDMPGLPAEPLLDNMYINGNGKISGLK